MDESNLIKLLDEVPTIAKNSQQKVRASVTFLAEHPLVRDLCNKLTRMDNKNLDKLKDAFGIIYAEAQTAIGGGETILMVELAKHKHLFNLFEKLMGL